MKSLRQAPFALWAVVAFAAPGCRTASLRDAPRPEASAPPHVTTSAVDLLAEHNRNARKVESLEARPSVTVNSRRVSGGLSGKMAFERDRNFKLVLSGPVNDLADIGSNDREFWFWVKDNQEPGVYFCNYDANGSSPLASSMQPDWIIEALGLRVIPDEEAEQIQVNSGKEPGTLVLTHKARTAQGQKFVKETVLSQATHLIREYRISSADKKTLLARAIIYQHQPLNLPARDGQPPDTVQVPKVMRLEWIQEKLVLDISLREVKVNPGFTDAKRALIFTEPEIKGVGRKNLAELSGLAKRRSRSTTDPDDRTTIRESLPAPPPRVRLDDPSPLGQAGRALPLDVPPELAVNLPSTPTRSVEAVVGAPIPRVSDPDPVALQANPGWRTPPSPALER